MIRILSIGNSFSQDAQRLLFPLAAANGIEIKNVNLYIGGCSLQTHYYNMLERADKYSLEYKGESTGFYVSIQEALMSDNWDYITLQQASHFSPFWETYQPYLNELAACVRKYCPHSKLLIHQTWSYEDNSEKLRGLNSLATGAQMYGALEECYARAAREIHADGLIPAGSAMMLAHRMGIEKVHRDTYHAALGCGRLLLAATWLCSLTGINPATMRFVQAEKDVSASEQMILREALAALRNAAML